MPLDPELKKQIDSVTALRPRRVLDHILEHGFVTTAELAGLYGYNHPPRAARDVREHGIPLDTFRVDGPDGRKIAAYRLGDPSELSKAKAGRRAFPKAFKDALIEKYGEECALCGWPFPGRGLQIDHRVPYEVAGEGASLDDLGAYMLVCGSCNRSKSWSCESCANWKAEKSAEVCKGCYWASPTDHEHVSMEQRRSLTIAWQGDQIDDYERLLTESVESGESIGDFARRLLRESLK